MATNRKSRTSRTSANNRNLRSSFLSHPPPTHTHTNSTRPAGAMLSIHSLLAAIREGREKKLRELLQGAASLPASGSGATPLQMAAIHGAWHADALLCCGARLGGGRLTIPSRSTWRRTVASDRDAGGVRLQCERARYGRLDSAVHGGALQPLRRGARAAVLSSRPRDPRGTPRARSLSPASSCLTRNASRCDRISSRSRWRPRRICAS